MPYASDGTGVIYCMTSPSGKKYIGQSWNWRHRQCTYRSMQNGNQVQIKLWRAFEKYGYDSFEIEILDYCYNQKQMDDAECYWISYYDSIKTGYNIREGGSRGKHTEEARRKIAEANRNRSKEINQKIVQTRRSRGPWHTSETNEKNRKSNERFKWVFIDPNGNEHETTNITTFSKEWGLNKGAIGQVGQGLKAHHKGWACKSKDPIVSTQQCE